MGNFGLLSPRKPAQTGKLAAVDAADYGIQVHRQNGCCHKPQVNHQTTICTTEEDMTNLRTISTCCTDLHFLSSQSQALRPPAPKCFNVYVDPNVEEVIQCRPVLQQVVARVTELLQEWPDHPTLNQVSSLSFSS